MDCDAELDSSSLTSLHVVHDMLLDNGSTMSIDVLIVCSRALRNPNVTSSAELIQAVSLAAEQARRVMLGSFLGAGS